MAGEKYQAFHSARSRTATGSGASRQRSSTGQAVREGARLLAGRRSRNGSSAARPISATTRVDRHLAARGDQKALVWISTEVDKEKRYTYRELHAEVNRCAAMMQSLGVKRGDRVLIYMPMIPEAASRCSPARASARSTRSCSAASPSHSLAARIDDARPKAHRSPPTRGMRAWARSCRTSRSLDEAIRLAKSPPQQVLLVNRGPRLRHEPRRRARRRLGGAPRAAHERPRALRLARIERAVVHPLHLGHHRPAEGRAARRRRLRGRAGRVDETHLLRRRRRDDVHHLATSAGWWGIRTSSTRRSSPA